MKLYYYIFLCIICFFQTSSIADNNILSDKEIVSQSVNLVNDVTEFAKVYKSEILKNINLDKHQKLDSIKLGKLILEINKHPKQSWSSDKLNAYYSLIKYMNNIYGFSEFRENRKTNLENENKRIINLYSEFLDLVDNKINDYILNNLNSPHLSLLIQTSDNIKSTKTNQKIGNYIALELEINSKLSDILDLGKIYELDKFYEFKSKKRNNSITSILKSLAEMENSKNPVFSIDISEIDALKKHISQYWTPPIGAADAENLAVDIFMEFNKEGYVIKAKWVNQGMNANNSFYKAAANSAIRAVMDAQPMPLPASKFNEWKTLTFRFDPAKMFGGY